MKIRTGYVSNSSSSMFIVAFPCTPKNAKEVQRILFGEQKSVVYDDSATPVSDIVNSVWRNIQQQKRWKRETIEKRVYDAVRGGWYKGKPDYNDYEIIIQDERKIVVDGKTVMTVQPRRDVDWKSYERAYDKGAKELTDRLLKQWKDKVIYIFHYGDEDGDFGSLMEHGGVFDALPNERISYH